MAPLPANRNGGGGESTVRSLPTPFLIKTYDLVDDRAVDDIISWNEDGSTFIVWNQTELARDLLPKYFKHNNFSSFVRQLNTYKFRKVVPDRWEFSNEFFRRGEKQLLGDIQRRKITTPSSATAAVQPSPAGMRRSVSVSDSGEEQVASSSDSPAVSDFTGKTSDLIGENKKLRKENEQLVKELGQMKSLCTNIYSLMSNFANNNNNVDECKSHSTAKEVGPMDLLPMTGLRIERERAVTGNGEESQIMSPGLGVGKGVKRGREGEVCWAVHEMDLQLQQPGAGVKSEPYDQDNGSDDQTQGRTYMNYSSRGTSSHWTS